MMNDDQLYHFSDVMKYLRASRSKIQRLIKSGDLVGHKLGKTKKGTWLFFGRDIKACIRIPDQCGA